MRGSVITFVVGTFFAALAVVLMNVYFSDDGDAASANANGLVPVVVSLGNVSFGAAIRSDQLTVQQWPASARPATAFHSVKEIIGTGAKPRLALREIGAGEPILQASVSGFGQRATLSRQVADGKRAASVRINDVSGVSGFTMPGDRVDILLTRSTGNSDDYITDVILQNVRVLGLDQLTDQQRQQPVVARTATVEVETEEAQKLALAQKLGTLSFALRNESASEQVVTRRISAKSLAGEQQVAISSGPTVQVRRGSEEIVNRSVSVAR